MSDTPRKGSLFIIFLTVFIDLLGFGIVLPLLPIYAKQFAETDGWTTSQAGIVTGLLMSSFSLMQFLFVPFWGRMSDRYGRRPILLIGLFSSMCFYALFGVATMFKSLIGLFLTRIGAGIAGATISTAQAYIADSTTKETRNKGMAIVGAAFALGFTLGPMLGSIALFMGGKAELSPWPGYFAAFLSGTAFCLALWLLKESWQPGADQVSRPMFDFAALQRAVTIPSIGLLLASTFISVFSFANFEATLSLQLKGFVDRHGDSQITSTLLDSALRQAESFGFTDPDDRKLVVVFAGFAYLGIVLTLVQGFLVRRLAGRISEGAMIGAGVITGMIGFVLLAASASAGNIGLFAGAMAIEVMGFAFVTPSLQSLISRRTAPEYQGGVLGLAQSFSSLGRILGPTVGTSLFVQSVALPYWLAVVIIAVGGLITAIAIRGGKDHQETNHTAG